MDDSVREQHASANCSAHGNSGKDEGERKQDERIISLASESSESVNNEDRNETEENSFVSRVNFTSEDNASGMDGCKGTKDNEQANKPGIFKKPVLIVGPRRGRTVGKVKSFQSGETVKAASASPDTPAVCEEVVECAPMLTTPVKEETDSEGTELSSLAPAQKLKEKYVPLPYKEPIWSGIAEAQYGFEVLKDGKIVESIELSSKPIYVIGRLSTCDIQMAHPTISRYHAIMQYRKDGDEHNCAGFYVYDLGSTHGTFLNKYRIKSNIHVRMQVGHMLKFGNSTRIFILQGPDTDQEQESELTVTELREKRRMEQEEREKEEYIREMEEKKREEEEGIDWGMGEDADEETDLSENPFAVAPNEELYVDDPKKTLRGWFEREGYDLEYNVEEKGFGQFLCTVELPIGNGMIAEALVKGKKKESVVQCALEACRILDRFGMLRQATHESRKRKAKNWEEDDFYDSDEDTFLDRTGAVEKKRQQRMHAAGKLQQEAETYESLLKKYNEVEEQIKKIEKQYLIAAQKLSRNSGDSMEDDEDALDAYMTQLSSGIVDKKAVSNLKNQLQSLQSEGDRLRKLVNIAKPASLPDLVPSEQLSKPQTSNKAALIAAVKRKVKAEQMSKMPHKIGPDVDRNLEGAEEDEEEEQEEADKEDKKKVKSNEDAGGSDDQRTVKESKDDTLSLSDPGDKRDELHTKKKTSALSDKSDVVVNPKIIGPSLPPDVKLNEEKGVVVNKEKKRSRRKDSKNVKGKVPQKMDYEYDESNPDYSVWVPPEGQTGDGRTKLNEKYGY